jgi:pyridoxal phosphate-dependent aminotransferase EpsN
LAARRRIFAFYRAALADVPGSAFLPEAPYGTSNAWLTCITVDPAEFGASRHDIQAALERANIESRPDWKPLHMQPVFAGCACGGGSVAGDLFERGLCLPSGSAMTDADLNRVVDIIRCVPQSTGHVAASAAHR